MVPTDRPDSNGSETERKSRTDPAESRLTIRLAGDELTLSLDGEMRVRDDE
ncbi:hypothetical protein [Haladaptatus sp. DYF46]|uniref:hypothetical protein n=1 Tax=Haladaptatus sp. DYF46 TaxID=2886041 RepID=UPI001E5015A3|nr:hypothetical protein [Haladaptatus sp. DYF46]